MIFLILLQNSSFASANGMNCSLVFEDHNQTLQFIAYFQECLDAHILGESDLKAFLKGGQIVNPMPHEKTPFGIIFTKSSHQIHYEAFEKEISNGQLNKEKIFSWVKSKLQENENKKEKRDQAKNETVEIFEKMIFHRVEPGTFMMGASKETAPVKVQITKPFQMMSTLVTQYMWARLKVLMGEKDPEKLSPSKFLKGAQQITIGPEKIPIKLLPDNPLEYVTWEGVQEFIDQLNVLSGTNDSKIQSQLTTVIPDHKQGDHYRLPTEAEWEFVLRGRGKYEGPYPDGMDINNVEDYAWFNKNADWSPKAVATKKPLLVEGSEFYDLQGNVLEWMSDLYRENLLGGVDPQGPLTSSQYGNAHVTRGGAYDTDLRSLEMSFRYHRQPTKPTQWIGFRLVRDI